MTNKANKEKVSDEVVAISAINAVLKTEGVHDLASGFSENISKNLLGREIPYKGIKISQDKESIIIDVHVNVKYNVKISIVAWDIQENVIKEVEKITAKPILQVNIHVQGIGFEETESQKGII